MSFKVTHSLLQLMCLEQHFFDGSCFAVFICLVLCPGLLPPQFFGQSSGRATIHQLLQIICEEIPWATHFVSGEAVVQETNFWLINLIENLVVDLQLLERLLIKSELSFNCFNMTCL